MRMCDVYTRKGSDGQRFTAVPRTPYKVNVECECGDTWTETHDVETVIRLIAKSAQWDDPHAPYPAGH